MADTPPSVVILAGPNGAGKTTAAPFVLRDALGVEEFVNADDVARGLSGFAPERAAVAAGRIMLARMRALTSARATFAFETTMATRSYAPWLSRLRQTGYRVTLIFLYLPSPDMAFERVRGRVAEGGHDVPEPVVRRRYARGLRNLWNLYLPLADDWSVYDNAGRTPDLMAVGSGMIVERVVLQSQWKRLRGGCGDE